MAFRTQKLNRLSNAVSRLEAVFRAAFVEVVLQTQDLLVLLINQQLDEGLTGTGQLPQYKPSSLVIRRRFGLPTGPGNRMILEFTGSFRDQIRVTANDQAINIFSTDPKNELLADTYGDEILEPNDESLEALKIAWKARFNPLFTKLLLG